jgi:tetratricopeptide (TPR) repeat protein
MKTIAIIITYVIFSAPVWAANEELKKALESSLLKLHTAETLNEARDAVNMLERISLAAADTWQAHYHYAYGNVMLSFRESDAGVKDGLLDKAEASIQKGHQADGDPSELLTLQAFVYQARISVDGSRAMQYSANARNILERALAANPENPRALFLNGQNIFYTPEAFGGGSKNAVPWFEKSTHHFQTNQPSSPIDPSWGEQAAQAMLEQCKQME